MPRRRLGLLRVGTRGLRRLGTARDPGTPYVNARKVWTVVAVIACIMSLGSPLFSGIGVGAKLGLASLHLVVGAAVILGLRRTALTAAERC